MASVTLILVTLASFAIPGVWGSRVYLLPVGKGRRKIGKTTSTKDLGSSDLDWIPILGAARQSPQDGWTESSPDVTQPPALFRWHGRPARV